MDNDIDIIKNLLTLGNIKNKYINFILEKYEIDILLNKKTKFTLKGNNLVKKLLPYIDINTFVNKINFKNYSLLEKEKIKDFFYLMLGYIEFLLDNIFIVGVGYAIVNIILLNIFPKKDDNIIKSLPLIEDKNFSIKQKNYVITLTYGEVAENHVGMQKLGKMAKEGNALNLSDFKKAKSKFENLGFKCKIIDLIKEGKVEDIEPAPESAYVLVIKNGINALTSKDFHINMINKEVLKDSWDKKAFMKGRVVNKLARYNLNYADEAQEPDYEDKKGRVIAFKDAPIVNKIREELPNFFGDKTNKLFAEGNFYYDLNKCGIGFHGDSERRIVVAVRLGDSNLPIHYQWFQNSEPIGKRIIIDLEPGDVYAMSEIAVGTNWKKRIIPTLRHATGCKKYLVTK